MRPLRLSATGTLYFRYVGAVLLLIWVVATIQGLLVYGRISPSLYILPSLVAITVGALLARSAVLKSRLHRTSTQFRAIADLAQEFTYLRLLDGSYEYVSPACQQLTGYSQEAFYQDPDLMDRLILPEDRARWRAHLQRLEAGGDPESFDIRLRSKDGRMVWFSHVCMPVYDERGRQVGVRSTNLDITERKQANERIERMAFYDSLTDLPNRTAIHRLIRELIDADPERRFALLLLDLNRFKNINDSLGHAFGDRLLKMIGARFLAVCPHTATLGRFGGDEFVVLLPRVRSSAEAEAVAARLLSETEKPLELEGTNLYLTASIGIAFFPDNGRDPDTLVRNADLAMYASKSSPTQTISFYADRFSASASQFASTEAALQQALRQQEFVPYYQAKVDLRSGQVVGLEALARWRHPTQGVITPTSFLYVAEETGQIAPVGWQILDRALDDLAQWQSEGIAVPLAVNISARQFAAHDFYAQIHHRLSSRSLKPSMLNLEITEQVFLGDLAGTRRKLERLRELGAGVSLDDFGTGYSSFSYLQELPISTLKIDRSFICDSRGKPTQLAILRVIAALCRELSLEAVVEGIETVDQREAVQALGLDLVQGFLFHQPEGSEQVTALLRSPLPVAGTAAAEAGLAR